MRTGESVIYVVLYIEENVIREMGGRCKRDRDRGRGYLLGGWGGGGLKEKGSA